jgi:ketosteroid isomerase-like protein
MTTRTIAILVAASAAVAALFWAKNYFSDEARVARLVKKMARAVEDAAPLALAECIAADYEDVYGLDKQSLVLAVQGYRRQFAALKISIQQLKISVENDRADAHFLAKATATSRGEGSETSLFADHFHLTFRQTPDGWKLSRTEGPDIKFH